MGRPATSVLPRGRAVAANDTERQSSARLDPLIDTVVNGRFRVRHAIARGGMGRVYYAIQEPLGRPIALKVIRDDEGAGDLRFRERFLVEADILSRLQHPNIVTLHDFGEMDGAFRGQSFIAMEFLDGETLSNRIAKARRLDPADVLSIAAQAARGLRAAHERGIVHRDLKPSNILVVRDADEGEIIVKLVDFGIGKLLSDADAAQVDLTGVGAVVGTPQFMAPEQAEGEAHPAADLYALGTIMFLALAGRLPFDLPTARELFKAKSSRPAPRLREVVPDLAVSERLESLVDALLARAPEARPRGSTLLREIEACRRELDAPACTPPSRSGATQSSTARSAPALCVTPPTAAAPAVTQSGEPRSRAARLMPYAIGALLLYAAALTYSFGQRESPLRDKATVMVTAPPPAAVPAPTAASPAPSGRAAPARPTLSVLVVETIPSGATVSEDGHILGVTPLQLPVEQPLGHAVPRRLFFQKSGYAPASIEQGASGGDARMVVALTPKERSRDPEMAPAPLAPTSPATTPARAQVFSTE